MQIHILEGESKTTQLLKQFLEYYKGEAAFITIHESEAKRIKHLILEGNKDFIDKSQDVYTWYQLLHRHERFMGTKYKALFVDNLDIMLSDIFTDKLVFATAVPNRITINKLH